MMNMFLSRPKALLTKFGANRLSEVKEDDYVALVAAAEELING